MPVPMAYRLQSATGGTLVRVSEIGERISYRIDSKRDDGTWYPSQDFQAKSLAQVAGHMESLLGLRQWDENSQALILHWQK